MKLQISLSMTSERQVARIAALEKLLTVAKNYYYNKGKFYVHNGKTITDAVYDKLEDELRSLSPKSKVLKAVRSAVPTGRKTVKLPFYLGSLDKMRPGETKTATWLEDHPGPYVVSDKLDGYSVPVIHRDGVWSVYSAGDDSGKAMDISHIAVHLNLPRVSKDIAVRGELLISKANFDRYSEQFKNARNMVAGVVTRKVPHESVADFDFVAHELLSPRFAPSKQFQSLKAMGFKVVLHKVYPTLTETRLIALLKSRKQSTKYLIDGLVVAQDKRVPLTVGSNPDSVIAFKNSGEEDTAITTVLGVEWTPSKHNYLKPVVLLAPVELSGVTVKRASGKNAYTIVHGYPKRSAHLHGGKVYPIGKGAQVKIVRSGEVIPDILKVVKPARSPELPKVAFKWTATEIDIIAVEATVEARDKQIANFFRTLGVENIDVSTVTKLVAAGFNTIIKIIRAKPAALMEVAGFKDRSALKLYNSIQAKTQDVPLQTLMDASGLFGRGIGTRKVLPVLKVYPNILDDAALPKPKLIQKLLKVDGYSDVTATQFAEALPKFVRWLTLSKISYKLPESIKQKGNKLQGQTIVFTGFRSKLAEDVIHQYGGTIAGNVSSKTTNVITLDVNSPSAKVKKAKDLGITLMTPYAFEKKYGLKIT